MKPLELRDPEFEQDLTLRESMDIPDSVYLRLEQQGFMAGKILSRKQVEQVRDWLTGWLHRPMEE